MDEHFSTPISYSVLTILSCTCENTITIIMFCAICQEASYIDTILGGICAHMLHLEEV